MTVTAKIELDQSREPKLLNGGFDAALKMVEEALGVDISQRGSSVILRGPKETVGRASALVEELRTLAGGGRLPSPTDLANFLQSIAGSESGSIADVLKSRVTVSPKKRPVTPKTSTQVEYIEAIGASDMIFGIGPAGTGKTYLAMAMAVSALLSKQTSRIVLVRPAVEAGERLGFLPGDIEAKVNPYLRPLFDALYDMMEVERAQALIDSGVIELAPLAFMRGRTLNDSFIILDEAQNTTSEQMKMYLTGLGYNSKTVITGDITQIDLPEGRTSGLVEAVSILADIEGIRMVHFTRRDVVRHPLVGRIVKAYEKREKRHTDRRTAEDKAVETDS